MGIGARAEGQVKVCGKRSAWEQPRGVVKDRSRGQLRSMRGPSQLDYYYLFAIGGEYVVGLVDGEEIV